MSFPRYPQYKDSGVDWLGPVPAHWEVKPFKRVFRERDERSAKGEETLLSVSAYTGVSPRSEIIDEGDQLTRADSLEGYKVCHSDDLVMNIMLAWNRGLAFTQYEGIVSPAYCVFSVTDGSVPSFLNYLVRSDNYTLYFKAFSAGVIDSRLRLYPDVFGSLNCCLPPLPEQREIAGFLDRETGKIDALVAEQERLLELLKEKRQAVISHAVTRGLNPNAPLKPSGLDWLGDIPAHWEVVALKRIAQVQTGVAKGKDNSAKDTITVPYLRVANVQDGFLDLEDVATIEIPKSELDRYTLQAGDVLMNEGGDFDKLGRGCVWAGQIEPCITQNHVFAVRPHGVTSEWLNAITSSAFAQFYFMGRSKQSTNLASISSTNLMELPVPLPPLTEQRAIVAHLDAATAQFDALTAEVERALALLQERRTALISAAVTGQIDVRAAT